MGGLSGIVSGLVSGLQGQPNYNLDALYNTVNQAGQYQRGIINALPPEIQQNLATYAQSLQGSGQNFQNQIQGQGQNYLQAIQGLYGPNSPAAQAQTAAARQNIYSTVPGTQNAIRNALAATGGLQRGNAATALASPYVNSAQQFGQAATGIGAQQTALQQQATQQALTTVNSMDASLFQQLFGMTQQQAATILQTGNQALRDQLTQLINQSNTQTNQTLGLEGTQAQTGFENTAARLGQQNAVYTGLANLGIQGAGALYGNLGGLSGILGGLSNTGGGASALAGVA